MLSLLRHHWFSHAVGVVFAATLGFGGAFGQISLLLHESVHVCSCPPDEDHECRCPECAGPHVAEAGDEAPCHTSSEESASSDEPVPVATLDEPPCGDETGARMDWTAVRALAPAPPVLSVAWPQLFPGGFLEPPEGRSLLDPELDSPPPRHA